MYELIRTPRGRAAAPDLDAFQRAVVAHPGGPLLVLAGPGTGKTTTLVESVVERIEGRGTPADAVLVLTFSRRAAADLRARISARLGRSVVTPLVLTFHAFCYALVRRFSSADPYDQPVRLLTAPEQEFRVRETLQGTRETGRPEWPDELAPAFGTRAFAAEVRGVLAKARQLGMDPDDVVNAGLAAGRPEWVSVGSFFDEYLDVLDAERVLDYAELVHRCRILLATPRILAAVRRELCAVFVDEYQDTDPAQVRLLQALAGDGRDVVVVGDPDQSIYSFRGAEPRGILDFPDLFPASSGTRAPVLALGQTRRFGRTLLAGSRSVAARLPLPRSLPSEVKETFRQPTCAPGLPRGRMAVRTYESAGAEAEHIAEVLREARLRDGLPWAQMAVLVRSGRRTIPRLSRALTAAGVPVEVAGDEIPLATEPAVRPLLLALGVAARGTRLTAEEAQVLLGSPLAGLDSMALRRLAKTLRDAERDELAGTGLPPPSSELVARALTEPDLLRDLGLDGSPAPEVAAALALGDLLARCRTAVRAGAAASEALWLLWSGTAWPERLRRDALAGGEGGQRADRHLDAVCALFDIAARSEEIVGRRGVDGFLAEVEGQQIPADTLREAEVPGRGVRVLTAHRAKGLEWDLVVVAGVQEGGWPDLRRRGSLLEADRLSRSGLTEVEPTSARLAEERRLFYVACTRARACLVVTAVAGTEGEGDQPSRFLAELGVAITAVAGRPRRPLSLPALVAELRSVSVDPEAGPALREQAALRLAQLAEAVDADGRPLVPAARPASWWGLDQLSDAARPVVAADEPVRLSGSQLGTLLTCPRQWFLAQQASAAPARTTAASFGSVVHALAEHAAHSPLGPDEMSDHLESIWDSLEFDANWLSASERLEAESALERFATWQDARTGQQLLGTEVDFRCEVEVAGERIRLSGTVDRVERDPDGRIRIVDFKTGRTAPTAADVSGQDQLGVYQLAVQLGAFAPVAGEGARPAGADLVYLRLSDGEGSYPRVFSQASLDEVPFPPAGPAAPAQQERTGPSWVHERLAEAVSVVREERFHARAGAACRYCPFASSCPASGRGRQVVA